MNELDLSNTQALIFTVILVGFLMYLNHLDRQRSARVERESTQITKTYSEDLSPDYGRYIQLAAVKPWGY